MVRCSLLGGKRYHTGGDTRYRMIISTTIIVLVYPLPVADEIIGAIQFKILCKQQVIYKDPDMESKKGAHLKVVIHERKRISDKAVPMTSTIFEFINQRDKSVLIKYVVFDTDGGFLARNFYLQEGGGALLFDSTCYPAEYSTLYRKFEVIN